LKLFDLIDGGLFILPDGDTDPVMILVNIFIEILDREDSHGNFNIDMTIEFR
jgi:hypothetical protein